MPEIKLALTDTRSGGVGQGKIKRLSEDTWTYTKLEEAIEREFKKEENEVPASHNNDGGSYSSFEIVWRDEEGDDITIENDKDLQIALNATTSAKILRLEIILCLQHYCDVDRLDF